MTTADTASDRFTHVYEAHHAAVERYVRRRIDDAAAVDVVAEVFLTAWRRFDLLPAEPLPWLYGTARRVLSNERRSVHRREAVAGRVAEHADTDVRDHAAAIVDRLTVAAALRRLSDDDAECLRLIAWEELTYRAAAQVLSCSLPAFVMRLRRARARLQQELSTASATAPARARLVPTRGEPS